MHLLKPLGLLALGLAVYLASPLGQAYTTELPRAVNLQADGRAAAAKEVPILVVFTAEHCAYCAALEAEQLRPMLISGLYEDRVMIRNLRIDSGKSITGFDGRRVTGEALASRYQVWVTPTIVFLDHNGNPLAPTIVGYNTPEMFGGYLDESIDQSQALLRGKLAARGNGGRPRL